MGEGPLGRARADHTGVYVSFLMEGGKSRIRRAYGDAKYERLRALKRKYDPDTFFRLNQNIPPGSAGRRRSSDRDVAHREREHVRDHLGTRRGRGARSSRDRQAGTTTIQEDEAGVPGDYRP